MYVPYSQPYTNPLSGARLETLESYCRISKIKFLQSILEIDTCWNSTLAMFKRYLYLHPAISDMCLRELLIPSCLDIENFFFCQFLKPFESATIVLSKERTNSISDTLMIILEIDQHIKKAVNNDMIQKMKKFEKYWTILIEVGEYNKRDAEVFVENIRQKIISIGTKYTNAGSTYVEAVEVVETDNYLTSDFLFPRQRVFKKRKCINTIEYELELYEKEPLEEFENKRMLFWESLSHRFSILSKMARDYLSIKPLSISSERAFSRAGFTITSNRANISEKPFLVLYLCIRG
ncbi:6573_t:CDS:2 [Dentiscutata erythropus]|uniref:6573_t:CDS:1 n=1 Tax=Dentiscutata erythropus TaxID=1348616 RepID=A0A9N9GRP4_9GLOM|nr:6573_t:CDS:2 [Dentiscutata erythropus]